MFSPSRRPIVFQSAPLTDVRGDRACHCGSSRPNDVSIRSPHGCKGRYKLVAHYAAGEVFQSAPLTDVRGDRFLNAPTFGTKMFQSAPLTDVRGDRFFREAQRRQAKFQSAPLTDVRGDKEIVGEAGFEPAFQSAPLTDVRGDPFWSTNMRWSSLCFNPLPSRM